MRVRRASQPYTVSLKNLMNMHYSRTRAHVRVRAYLCEGQHTRGARQRTKKGGVEEMERVRGNERDYLRRDRGLCLPVY